MKIKLDDEIMDVSRSAYVKAKGNQMREFGYEGLTDQEVDDQITAVLEGKKFGNGLTIIGKFMEEEIISDGTVTVGGEEIKL